MATPVSAIPLPFLAKLAKSPRRADRALWLRIALDALGQTGAKVAVGSEFAQDFAAALADLDPTSQVNVVQRLCTLNNVPRVLWDVVLGLDGEPRRLALSRAGVVKRETLMSALSDPTLAPAVASRPDLDADMTDRIIEMRHYPSLVALAGNFSMKLEPGQLLQLAELARSEGPGSALGTALLARSPVCAQHAPLFLQAASPQRVQILLALQRLELGKTIVEPGAPSNLEALQQLEHFALEGSQAAFADMLGQWLECDEALAERIASDPHGEPLAAVLAALGAAGDVSVRILTARDLNDGADKYRRLGSLIRLRDALSPTVARKVVAAMVGHAWREPILRTARAAERRPDLGSRALAEVERSPARAAHGSTAAALRPQARRRFTG